MTPRCLFISTVTNEFLTCRQRLSEDLRFPDVIAQNQEAYIAKLPSGISILVKLDDYISQCDAVIHLIGHQTSKDGSAASKDSVDDLFIRHSNFAIVVGLSDDDLRKLSYTQWEAWLAYYHIKTKRPQLKLIIATPTAAFKPDNPADPATAHAQKDSQARHEKELRSRSRYAGIPFSDEKDLSIQVLRALKDILPSLQPAQKIAPSRLVSRHTSSTFIGRETELALLDAAWAGMKPDTDAAGPEPWNVNLLSLIAWGGVGKTASTVRGNSEPSGRTWGR